MLDCIKLGLDKSLIKCSIQYVRFATDGNRSRKLHETNPPTRAKFITEFEVSVFNDDGKEVASSLRIECIIKQQRIVDILRQECDLDL